jgi:hypothetical protein
MSGDNATASRSPGRALIVGRPPFRGGPAAALHRRGYLCTEVDEPYEAMVNLCRRPQTYSAIVLSLNSLYREELPIIASIRRRFSQVDIWLSDTDGRQAALAEAMRLGADGLFADDGLHRVAGDAPSPEQKPAMAEAEPVQPKEMSPEKSGDPLLTAEELRALLRETPTPHIG